MQVTPKISDTTYIYNTLPKVINIKLIRLFKNPYDDNETNKLKNFLLKSHRIISNKQIIYFSYNDNFFVDILYGVFKNNLSFYIISEIEYEDFDYLRTYIKNDTLLKKQSTSNNKNSLVLLNFINSFVINNTTKIEILEHITLSEICSLPHKCLQNYFNYMKFLNNNSSTNNLSNSITILSLKQYKQTYKEIKDLIKQNLNNKDLNKRLTILLTGQNHSGKGLMIKKITDNFGLYYKSKSIEDFISLEQFLTYLKKCEFLYQNSIVVFKDCNKFNLLFKLDNADNFLKEVNFCLNIKRDFKLIILFDFEKLNDVPAELKNYIDFNFDIILPNIETRKEIFEIGISNIKLNWKFIFTNDIKEIFNELTIKFKCSFEDFFINQNNQTDQNNINNNSSSNENYNTYLEDISKLTIGSTLSELRQITIKAIELFRNDLHNQETLLPFTLKYLKNAFNLMKPHKIIHEKQSTSIPEVKWQDIGGLEDAKKDINETIQLPLKYPNLFNSK